ncbi:MAG: FAD-dependent monooxygenase, partial [Betaproteobacteria bacterium]
MTTAPIAILGGGPVGLTLALLLARRRVPSVVVDARGLDDARRDRRLLALSRGTLDTLGTVVDLPSAALAPIRAVVVSSRGEFGRAVLDEREHGGQPLGATIRYGDLVAALDAACAGAPLVEVRRQCTATAVSQGPTAVDVHVSDGTKLAAAIAVNAEGAPAGGRTATARQSALTGDVEVQGPVAGTAFERFTRDGPLALLPLAGPAAGTARPMSLVWCMPTAVAERREALSDADLLAELQAEFGDRNGRM